MGAFLPFLKAAAPILGAVAGGIFSRNQSSRAYGRSQRLMYQQYGLDKDMFDYQNKYNTPHAQMQRLKQAGLNPALMYGQGTTGNASGFPQSKFTQLNPYMEAGDIGQLANSSIQMALMNATRKDIDASAELKKTQADRNKVLTKKDKREIKLISRKIVNMDTQTAKMLQETTNLKTVNQYERLKVELEKKVVKRANKGIIKGDTIGNILEMFGLDPVNNQDHRNWLYGALGAWYGSTVAKNIMQGVGSIIPSKRTFEFYNPTTNNYNR